MATQVQANDATKAAPVTTNAPAQPAARARLARVLHGVSEGGVASCTICSRGTRGRLSLPCVYLHALAQLLADNQRPPVWLQDETRDGMRVTGPGA
jgi:hypothetical protein